MSLFSRSLHSFSGRVVVVTGAAAGIGRAIATRFARAGARVVLLDRDGAAAEAAAGELRAAGLDAGARACDVTDAEGVQRAMDGIAAERGGIDVLVNNAGISHRSPFAETDVAVFRKVMEVNYFGAVNCTRAALPSLLSRRGLVAAISSVAGFAPLLGRTGYCASKHALHGLFDTLRAETEGTGLRVMLVCPSFVATGMDERNLGAHGGRPARPKSTVGRQLTPEDVADALFAGAERGERLVTPSPVARASWWLSRLAPSAYSWVMARTQRAEMAGAT